MIKTIVKIGCQGAVKVCRQSSQITNKLYRDHFLQTKVPVENNLKVVAAINSKRYTSRQQRNSCCLHVKGS